MIQTSHQNRSTNKTISKISGGGSSFLLVFSGIALTIMVLLVTYDVILRNVFGSAMNGVAEYVSEWLMPATILFGLAYTEHKREHIRVTIIEDSINGGPQKALKAFGQLTAVVVSAVLAWSSLQLALGSFDIRETVPMGTDLLPVWPIKLAVFLGWVWLTVQTFSTLISFILPARANTPISENRNLVGLEPEGDSRA